MKNARQDPAHAAALVAIDVVKRSLDAATQIRSRLSRPASPSEPEQGPDEVGEKPESDED